MFCKKKKRMSHGGGTHKGDCGTVNTPKRHTVKGKKQLCKQVQHSAVLW